VATPRRFVWRVRQLRDDALDAEVTRLFQEFRAVSFDVIAVTQDAMLAPDQLLQHALPFEQRGSLEVEAFEVNQVKDFEHEPLPGGLVNGLLQHLKTTAARAVHRHDLSIEDRTLHWECLQGLHDVRKLVSPILLIPGPQTNVTALQMTQQTITVELQLVQPLFSFGRFFYKRCELRRNKLRHRRLARARNFFDFFRIHRGGWAALRLLRDGSRCTRRNWSIRFTTWFRPAHIKPCVGCASVVFR